MRQNNPQNYEPLNVYLTPTHTPIAYKNKVECLKLAGHPEGEAQQLALEPIELELYYETGHGLFAVESDAVESGIVCSPYTQEDLEDEEHTPDKEQEVKIIPPFNMSQVDLAYSLSCKITEISRKGLIELVERNNGKMIIPEHNGGPFSLSMLNTGYNTFFFNAMTYDGKTLAFTGANEGGDSLNIYEHDLPDNGLLYIYDYLSTGNY